MHLPNWVGDVCMALPALELLGQRGFRVHALGKAWAVELLGGLPITVRALPTGFRATVSAWRATDCRDGVLFTNSFETAFPMWWAGLRATGYRHDLRGPFLGQGLTRTHHIHDVDAYWRLAVAVLERHGCPPPTEIPRMTLPLSDSRHRMAEAALAAAGVSGPFVVLCPLAIGTIAGRSKCWPWFPALCRWLVAHDIRVVSCPGPGEEAATAAALPGATVLSGLTLGAFAGVLSRATRVVANDSGPMHLAAVVGAPVLGIFGRTDPQRTSPWSSRGRTVGDETGWPSIEAVTAAYQALPEGR